MQKTRKTTTGDSRENFGVGSRFEIYFSSVLEISSVRELLYVMEIFAVRGISTSSGTRDRAPAVLLYF
jgi:hypothetical protein